MKIKNMFSWLIVLSFFLFLWGCEKPIEEEPDELELSSIVDVLTTATNNQEVMVEGVVFAKVNSGYYISDSDLGKIFVTDARSVTLGDKVNIVGEFGIAANMPRIKNVSKFEVIASGQTLPTPTEMTVEQILSLQASSKTGSYAKFITVTGTLESLATEYVLRSDGGSIIYVANVSNLVHIAQKVDTRVTMNVVVHEYYALQTTWRVTFAGGASDIVDAPIDFNTLKDYALTHINSVVPGEIFGALVLPTGHPTIAYLTYTWEVEANDYVSIDNTGRVLVTLDEASDHTVNFTVTITDGESSDTAVITVVSKAIAQREVSEMYTNMPSVEGSVVIVRGIVVAITRNQTLSLRSLIIQDIETKDTISVDFAQTGSNQILHEDPAFTQIKVGDEVVVRGTFRVASRQTIHTVTSVNVLRSNVAFSHDYENAFVLNNQASFAALAANFDTYSSRLVKFEDPFMNYSTSTPPTSYNWVRLGYDAASPNQTHGGSRYFALQMAANNEAFGSDIWYSMLDIPLFGAEAQQYGGDVYAYVMYLSDTYISFVMPDADAWQYENEKLVAYFVGAGIPETIEEGSVVLPTTHPKVTGTISWASSNEDLISSTTGLVEMVDVNTVVTLTATYTYDGNEYSTAYEITILGSSATTVSELLESGTNGERVKLKGLIVGYQSDGNSNVPRDGVILMDEDTGELLLINGMGEVGGQWGAYLDSDGLALTIGHEIQIVATFYTTAPAIGTGPEQTGKKFVEVTSSSQVKRLSETLKPIPWKTEDALVIETNQDLIDFVDNLQFGTLLKFVGTPDNPIYIGGSSTTYASINIKIFKNAATSNDETKYDGQTFSLKNNINTANAGPTWLKDMFGVETGFVGPTVSAPAIPFVGDMYVVLAARTSTYFQLSLVNYEAAAISPDLTETINTDLRADLPGTAEAGPFGFTLPTTHPNITGSVTWTSSHPAIIDIANSNIAVVEENTVVTLEGTYIYSGSTRVVVHPIMVQPGGVSGPMSVAQVLSDAIDGMTVDVKGIVVGFHWNGSSTINAATNGVMLKDATGNDVLYVVGLYENYGTTRAQYTVGSDTLALGDEITFTAVYSVATAAGFVGRKTLTIQSAESANLTILNREVAYSFDTSAAVTISDDAGLVDLAENLTYGKLYKLEGAFSLRSSTTAYGTGTNYSPSFANSVDTDYNQVVSWIARPQRFSFKLDGNIPNLGENWWISELNITSENFSGTAAAGHVYDAQSYIYFYVGNALPTATTNFGYIQLVILDAEHINATRVIS